MKFIKYHAIGNDYLVYDDQEPFNLTPDQISQVCHRNTGIGSDGILVKFKTADGHFKLKIFNPDGSEAEKSGNGLRIFSRYLWDQSEVHSEPFNIVTAGGEVTALILDEGRNVEVSMGKAKFLPDGTLVKTELVALHKTMSANLVSMGNPHCVIFQERVSPEFTKTIGPLIEKNSLFENGSNVQFVQVLDDRNIKVEIWERGAGYTLSSGSSSCAAAAASYANNLCSKDITVHMQGGKLKINIDDDFNVRMTGPVSRIGTFYLSSDFF